VAQRPSTHRQRSSIERDPSYCFSLVPGGRATTTVPAAAGSKGNFGLVIGIVRKGNAEELKRHGAHLVVRDLVELMD